MYVCKPTTSSMQQGSRGTQGNARQSRTLGVGLADAVGGADDEGDEDVEDVGQEVAVAVWWVLVLGDVGGGGVGGGEELSDGRC